MQLHQAQAASKMTSVEYFPLECGGKSQFLKHGPPNHSRREDDRETTLVVEPTHLKNMIVKMGIFPNFRGENSKNI